MKSISIIWLVLIALIISSCKSTYVPSYLTEKTEITMNRGYGAMCDVGFFPPNAKYFNEENIHHVIGELIASDDSSIIVLQYDFHLYLEKNTNTQFSVYTNTIQGKADTMRIFKIPKKRLTSLQLVTFRKNSGTMPGWILLSTIWSASHGIMLIFTMPFNWIVDGFIASSHSKSNLIEIENTRIDPNGDIKRNCRFPQGLYNIDITKLKPKVLIDD